MEDNGSGGGGRSCNTNIQNRHHFRSSPRLPLDKFLWAHHQNQFSSHQQVPNVVFPENSFLDVSLSSSSPRIMVGENSSDGHAASVDGGASWLNPQEVSFLDAATFLHGMVDFRQGVDRSAAMNINVNESSGRQVNCRSSTSTLLIKGQWSEEEDRY